MTKKDLARVAEKASTMLGLPYGLGHKWDIKNPKPEGPIDCSGIVCWAYCQATGLIVPDGSYYQYDASDPIQNPLPGDVGFFEDDKGNIHHVGIVSDTLMMVEARGEPYNAVIVRPRARWEAWKGFAGYRRFRAVQL